MAAASTTFWTHSTGVTAHSKAAIQGTSTLMDNMLILNLVVSAPEACGTVEPINAISTSYSSNEADLTAEYEERQCLECIKLGLQSVLILYSSGVFGVTGTSSQFINPVTGAFNNGPYGLFNPSFLGTCPYIISVGAKQVLNGSAVRSPENASERVIFSGGGSPNIFPIPLYQKSALATYFSQHVPRCGADRFNNSQNVCCYPDVPANGVNYVVAVNGQFSLAFGTSSCPTFAALVNTINARRLSAKKSTVGFLNLARYANPQVLNDVTLGDN